MIADCPMQRANIRAMLAAMESETPATMLRAWRVARGWTMQETADLAGLHVSTLHKLETGEERLSPGRKVAVARALGARVRDLFESEPVLPEAVG